MSNYEILKEKLKSFREDSSFICEASIYDKLILDKGALLNEGISMEGYEHSNDAYSNVCKLYISENKPIVVGYALSESGTWTNHAWTLGDKGGHSVVLETTNPHILYYGAILDDNMAEEFFLEHNTMI